MGGSILAERELSALSDLADDGRLRMHDLFD